MPINTYPTSNGRVVSFPGSLGGVHQYPAAVSGGGFDPTSVSGLVGWWDARYVNGKGVAQPSNGASISTWTDLSGLGNHAVQTTSGNRPAFTSTGPGLTWNTAAYMLPPLDDGTVLQLYAVVNPSGFRSDYNGIMGAVSGGAPALRMQHTGTDLDFEKDGYNVLADPGYTMTTGTGYVLSASYANPGTTRLRSAGADLVSGFSSTITFLTGHNVILGSGAAGQGTNGWQGSIQAIALYTSVHTTATCLQIEEYFGTAFGIAVA